MNRLSKEKSPYLLQHKNNPVWWFPWGPEAFEAAKKNNKPIFLSIGYSTCHWCHVMEKDSFEINDVADVLNKDFISIKVDREERPDVDSVYMNAVQTMTGRGGWPMSVLLTPDGKPFWGGTFVPHDQFLTLMARAAEIWKSNPAEIIRGGDELTGHLKTLSHADLPESDAAGAGPTIGTTPLIHFYEMFKDRFDQVFGGNRGAPKFPPSLALLLLLRIHRRTNRKDALDMVEKTLSSMRRGGIYDQLGGGFHRYSVDDHWLIPHYEKMLYDNALLATACLETFQATGNPEFARTAREILDYVLRDMTGPDGGFYSAEDADSENVEGKFYVWPEKELQALLTATEFQKIKLMFHFTDESLFEAHKTGTELSPNKGEPAISGYALHLEATSPLPDPDDKILQSAMKKMWEARNKRPRPHLDDKILTGWNGLMISALAKGFQILNEPKYLKGASRAAEFLLTRLRDKKGNLLKRFRDNEAGHRATADDYGFFIEGLLNLYECDFAPGWFLEAQSLQEKQNQFFWDDKGGSYFDSDGTDPNLIIRQKTFEDNVIPSANSTACNNLLKLFALTGTGEYHTKALSLIKAAGTFVEKYPVAVPKLLMALDHLTDDALELAVAASDGDPSLQPFLEKVRKIFNPNLTLAMKTDAKTNTIPLLQNREELDDQITFYICRGGSCKLPSHDAESVLSEISKIKTF